jgi:hypothetical protein
MNIPALEANVEEIDRRIARLERELEAMRLERQLTVNDIATARLQAWYAANPGIELRVGDEFEVTDETYDLFGQTVYIIEIIPSDLDVNRWRVRVVNKKGVRMSVRIDDARRMREAWLAQEAGA